MIPKCKAERPQCSNCITSKRTCGGYLRKHTFILSQDMLSLEPVPLRAMSSNVDSGDLMVARWRADPAKPSQPSQRTKKMQVVSLGGQQQYRTNRLPYHVSSHHAGLQQVLEIFLTSHLPTEELNNRQPTIKQRNWLLQIQETPILTPALESSILAICLAKLGRRYNDEALVQEGLFMYTVALPQLRQALRNPRARCDDKTIAACIALMMFESTQCPDRSIESCMAHHRGAITLLLLRPPEAYTLGWRIVFSSN